MIKKTTQTINGKAFEYALLYGIYLKLKNVTCVVIKESEAYLTAKNCFQSLTEQEQKQHNLHANCAISFLLDLEPRIFHATNDKDILELEIVADKAGQTGDVRDVLAIRMSQKWQIGISAKNNHRAVKHSRLSSEIDFGKKWLNIPCSNQYFAEINPIFDYLDQVRKTSNAKQKWNTLDNYHQTIYLPILLAFKTELLRLAKTDPKQVATNLVLYLIGNLDFYKIIKGKKQVEIQAYNLQGTLNLPFNSIRPKAKIARLKLPTKILDVSFKENSQTTLVVTFNEGWQMSFRIHNASSRIEPSLKFDINLISSPHTLFTNILFVE